MKLIIKVADIPQILEAVDKIIERDPSADRLFAMYSTIDPSDVIRKLKFIDSNNKNLYCPNGPSYSWGRIANEVELSYEEYEVVTLILRVMRNLRENKDLWYVL